LGRLAEEQEARGSEEEVELPAVSGTTQSLTTAAVATGRKQMSLIN